MYWIEEYLSGFEKEHSDKKKEYYILVYRCYTTNISHLNIVCFLSGPTDIIDIGLFNSVSKKSMY